MLEKHYRLGFYKHINESTAQPEVVYREFKIQEYERMREKTQILWDSQELYLSWSMVKNNNERYLNSTKDRKEKISTHERLFIASKQSILITANISQEVTNFLAVASTFLIVSQRFIQTFFGNKSSEYNEWNKYRQKLHADSLPYRVSYELRNFSQHYTIPLSGTEFSFKNGELSVDTYIDTKKLLECGYDWKKFSNTLKNMDDIVQLSYLIEGYFNCLEKIITKTSELILDHLNASSRSLQHIYKDYDLPQEVVPIIFEMDGSSEDFNKLNQEYIPTYLMEYIESITKDLVGESE